MSSDTPVTHLINYPEHLFHLWDVLLTVSAVKVAGLVRNNSR